MRRESRAVSLAAPTANSRSCYLGRASRSRARASRTPADDPPILEADAQGLPRRVAAISLPAGLEIDDIPVLMTNGKAWATLPARPVISSDVRVAKIPGTGKTLYVSFLRWRDRALSTAFSERVVELVLERHPAALDGSAEG